MRRSRSTTRSRGADRPRRRSVDRRHTTNHRPPVARRCIIRSASSCRANGHASASKSACTTMERRRQRARPVLDGSASSTSAQEAGTERVDEVRAASSTRRRRYNRRLSGGPHERIADLYPVTLPRCASTPDAAATPRIRSSAHRVGRPALPVPRRLSACVLGESEFQILVAVTRRRFRDRLYTGSKPKLNCNRTITGTSCRNRPPATGSNTSTSPSSANRRMRSRIFRKR